MRTRDYDMRDLNYQNYQDKEHMGKQVGLMQRELTIERDSKAQLELIEGDLVHKLQVLEGENSHFKGQLREQDGQLAVKSEAIEKAQRIIQKLSDEMEKTTQLLCVLEKERDQLRIDTKDQSRRIQEVTKQMHS